MSERNIEAVYPLTPLQEGMLFHVLRDAHLDLYVIQYAVTLRGAFDEDRFREAWLQTVRRHAPLRTFFTWERRERPLQVVRERVDLPITRVDWRGRSDADRARLVAEWMNEDLQRGFDLSNPPLMRLVVFRLGEEEHRFLWSVHHMLLDGWSGGLVLREVYARYEALGAGQAHVPPAAPEFARYVAWLGQRDLAPAESFWRRTLEGFRVSTPLPTERPRPRNQRPSVRSSTNLTLSTQVTATLDRACRRLRVTPNTMVLAAWALALSRLSGLQDVVFGVTVAHRPHEIENIEHAVGLLFNTIPFRVRVDETEEVAAWLPLLQSQLAACREHEHAPLSAVQRWSEVAVGKPLFETLVVFENFPPLPERLVSAGLELVDEAIVDRSNYPLALLVFPGTDLRLTAVYADDRVAPESARILLERVATLLASLADADRRRVRDVELLSPRERACVVGQWCRSAIAPLLAVDVIERFESQVRQTPEALALADPSERLSYAELNRRSNQLARHLRAAGVGPGAHVALLLPRSAALVMAMLSVLKAGGAYVPLSTRTPRLRLAQVLEELSGGPDDTPGFVITKGTPIEGAGVVVDLARDRHEVDACETGNLDPIAAPTDAAYVIFTSGSTGAPKGILIERRNLAFSIAARLAIYPATVRSFLLLSSPAVDSSVAGIYWSLCSGGSLVTPADHAEQSIDGLAELIESYRVSHTLVLPSLYRTILEHAPAARLASLECVVVAGEQCPADLLRRHHEVTTADLYNEYGPAEASVWATATALAAGEPVTIGRPVPGALVYLLDDRLIPVPVGAVGEIFIGGGGVARGYVNRDGLTRERFVASPFERDGRLYRTGDLGRWLADGRIEFRGRADEQVKIRGYRVELGELQRTLERHPGVEEAAGAYVPRVPTSDADESGSSASRLVVYWVPAAGEAASPEELKAFVAERLPEYMVPVMFVQLAALPRIAGGKLDRSALPAPPEAPPDRGPAFVAPRTAAETTLADIWKAVLGIERVGVHDDFFEVGGDSLSSIRVLARARRDGIVISPEQFFAHPTIAALAGSTAPETTVADSPPAPREVPLTPIQHWFFENVPDEQHHWNQSFLFSAPRDLDLGVLERIAMTLLEHHDGLRATFERRSGQLTQVFRTDLGSPVRHVDLAGQAETSHATVIASTASAVHGEFELAKGPLIRFVLFDPGRALDKHLLVVAHHLVVDGVSWGVLFEDLDTLFRQARKGEAFRLPPATASFGAWAGGLTRRAGEFTPDATHWLEMPEAGPLPAIDHRVSRTLNRAGAARRHTVALDGDASRAVLSGAARRLGTRGHEALLAALLQAWADWSGESHLVFDLEGHGRDVLADELDVSRTVGWFTTVFPVCLYLDEARPEAIVRSVQRQLRAAEVRGAGHGILRYLTASAVSRSLATRKRPEVLFNFMGNADTLLPPASAFRLIPTGLGPERHPQGRRAYVLAINGRLEAGRLLVDFEYAPSVHEASTIESLAARFSEALLRLAGHAGEDPARISLSGLDAEGLEAVSGMLARLDEDE